jgi:hypothetical protein
MDFNINNSSVSERITTCLDELDKIDHVLKGMGSTSHPAPFLTRYSIMRSCGTIEYGFKAIISDIHEAEQTPQLKNFIDQKFRNTSMNPSYDNICKSLGAFDENWKRQFKLSIKDLPNHERVKASLEALNGARNQFAHGGAPTMSFSSLMTYFQDSLKILEIVELVVEGTISSSGLSVGS